GCFYSRPAGERFVGAGAEHRIRFSKLRAVQEHDRVQKHRLWTENQEMEKSRSRGAGGRSDDLVWTGWPGETVSASIVRPPAATRGHRPRPGSQTQCPSPRR